MDKPIKARPQFYAVCFEQLRVISMDLGYNLLIHGSLNRDLDLVAVPWTESPASHMSLLKTLDSFLNGEISSTPEDYMYSSLPGGRHSYVINLNRGKKNSHIDPQYYLDISITPLVATKVTGSDI